MKLKTRFMVGTVIAFAAARAIAQPTPLAALQEKGELHLSRQSPDICRGISDKHEMLPCSSPPYKDHVDIKRGADGNYAIEIEKRYGHVSYDDKSKKEYVSPFYCAFGGSGQLSGNELVVTQNRKEDGSAIRGLKVVFDESSIVLVDENRSENSRFCGFIESFNGLTFSFSK